MEGYQLVFVCPVSQTNAFTYCWLELALHFQIGLFWGIACGQVQEKVYHHQADTIAKIKATLAKYDLQNKVNGNPKPLLQERKAVSQKCGAMSNKHVLVFSLRSFTVALKRGITKD